jgi:putative endonuclease
LTANWWARWRGKFVDGRDKPGHDAVNPAQAFVENGDAQRLGLHDDEPAERRALHGRDVPHRPARLWRREGLAPGFTKRYGLKRLVSMEFHDTIGAAIQRESNIKHWPRAWKVRLILDANPAWNDLYDALNN